LLAATRTDADPDRWSARHGSQTIELRAFADIDAQRYSVYQDVAG